MPPDIHQNIDFGCAIQQGIGERLGGRDVVFGFVHWLSVLQSWGVDSSSGY